VIWPRAISLVNGLVVADEGFASSIRFGGVVLGLDERPGRGDLTIDLDGAIVFPGLVNAHDHLELNHIGRLRFRRCYANAVEWARDVGPRLRTDPLLVEARRVPLDDRLLIGALKNLLAGATTVAHHNPHYRQLGRRYPVRVVRRYGWAHSLALERAPVGAHGEPGGPLVARYRRTPPTWPFVVHAAEGTDEAARAEVARLAQLGCLGPNVVLVHGVGASRADWARVAAHGAGLVWCPASNLFLLGATVEVKSLVDGEGPRLPIALGSDSRLSGSRDLLDELRLAAAVSSLAPRTLARMVTTEAARLLRCGTAGRLAPGLPADLLILPPLADDPFAALLAATRSDLLAVVVNGRPLVAAPHLAAVFAARGRSATPVRLDGVARLLDATLARRVASASVREPGLECSL
jgi:hypothetical protein